ncbi:MAG TPA: hypothetical protein VMS95_06065 [Candidatus Krumholzibacteriaceae bacterium]|nr:hypothetical protein [Candidatus Krumholzibacteriaceae bacterium]
MTEDYLDIPLETDLLNAAGMLGFAPNPRGPVGLNILGAFVTAPVSLTPRTPAESRCLIPFPGGFLLHTGLPNPGLRAVIQRYAQRWAASPLPVIVHLLTNTPPETAQMVHRLEEVEGVAGIEVGLAPQVDPAVAAGLARAAQGELPVILSVPLDRVIDLSPDLRAAGVSTISLAPPRGTLPGRDGRLLSGRLYGPALLPAALKAVQCARQAGFRVIGAGGVYSPADAEAMRAAGAFAIQLDTVLWKGMDPEWLLGANE